MSVPCQICSFEEESRSFYYIWKLELPITRQVTLQNSTCSTLLGHALAWKKIEFFVRFFHHFLVCSWSNKALRRDPDVEIPNLHSKIETGGCGPKPRESP